MYEYAVMVKNADVKPEALVGATGSKLTEIVGVVLGKATTDVSKGTESFQGGGWEIMSHQLTRFDQHFVASFLLRRPKR